MKTTRTRPARPSSPVMKPRMTTKTDFLWLETKHFLSSGETVLLRWNRPSGPVYRTGRFNFEKSRYLGSGDVEFRTQPDEYAEFNYCEHSPVLVLDMSPAGQEWLVEEMAKASDSYFDSIASNHEAFKAYDHARAIVSNLQRSAKGGRR